MTRQEFILQLIAEGKDYLKMVLTFLVGWHLKQPGYMKKNNDKET